MSRLSNLIPELRLHIYSFLEAPLEIWFHRTASKQPSRIVRHLRWVAIDAAIDEIGAVCDKIILDAGIHSIDCNETEVLRDFYKLAFLDSEQLPSVLADLFPSQDTSGFITNVVQILPSVRQVLRTIRQATKVYQPLLINKSINNELMEFFRLKAPVVLYPGRDLAEPSSMRLWRGISSICPTNGVKALIIKFFVKAEGSSLRPYAKGVATLATAYPNLSTFTAKVSFDKGTVESRNYVRVSTTTVTESAVDRLQERFLPTILQSVRDSGLNSLKTVKFVLDGTGYEEWHVNVEKVAKLANGNDRWRLRTLGAWSGVTFEKLMEIS